MHTLQFPPHTCQHLQTYRKTSINILACMMTWVTYDNAVAQDRIDRVNGDLGDVRRGRDVREVRCRPPLRVAQVDKPSDEAVETERDVRRGEAEHEHGDPEDDRRDLARAAEAEDVDIGAEQADVDPCARSWIAE